MFDEDALPGVFLLCVQLDVSGGRGHSQNHGCADLNLNVEEVVPDVFEIHILGRKQNKIGSLRNCLDRPDTRLLQMLFSYSR